MSDSATRFVAVLVFTATPGRRTVESHLFTARHPEIARQRALSYAQEQRFGREFVGFATLEPLTEELILAHNAMQRAESETTSRAMLLEGLRQRRKGIAALQSDSNPALAAMADGIIKMISHPV